MNHGVDPASGKDSTTITYWLNEEYLEVYLPFPIPLPGRTVINIAPAFDIYTGKFMGTARTLILEVDEWKVS